MIQKTTLIFSILLFSLTASFAQKIPSPKEHFGFNIGDNYKLANYTQTEAYFKKIAAASDRVKLVNIGKTEEDRDQYMLIVSSPGNIKNLDRYKEISMKLARAEGITDKEAQALATEGKAVVWIDGGLHATETVGTHQLIETLYRFVSGNDPETLRILNDVIILLVHANPDGQQLVSDWYMSNPDTLKRSYSQLPRLYQKYVGHDNNRDFFMMNMKETRNMSRQLYIEWMPQVLYNHHQSGPAGSVVAGPPYRDPFNYLINPLTITSIDAVGAAMINRLNVEGKPGYTKLGGATFSTWYNGGLRTTSYFHNIVGLLTEIIGNPTPMTVPLVPSRLLPSGSTPYPVKPQKWLFRQSIEYSVSLNYAVLDYAARNREHLLYNIYKMGMNSIEAGNNDYWTLTPKKIDAINNAYKKDQAERRGNDSTRSVRSRAEDIPLKYYNTVLKDSTLRDPRGYIIPANQSDYPTALTFINALIQSGIKVNKATADFSVEGKKYPSGSYIVLTNQAFRPHVIDMFDPQDHPNDFQYPGGPPIRPYDIAGWTPAFSMGFRFERILNKFDGPFQPVAYGEIQVATGKFNKSASATGYILDCQANNTFIAINYLLKSGADVYRITKPSTGTPSIKQGSFYISAKGKSDAILEKAASELGITIVPVTKRPENATEKISASRVALWDQYGGNMSSGWTRWILEQNKFPFSIIYSKEIDGGKLREKYDVIIFVSGAIPPVAQGTRAAFRDSTPKEEDIPAEYRSHLGRLTAARSIPALKQFLEAGGTVITIGTSANLAYHLKLPVKDALVEIINGKQQTLPPEKYFIPGSIMHVMVDSTNSVSWGMRSEADVFFDSSPVFKIAPDAISKGEAIPIAWFASDKTLRSGWAWGQEYLQDGVAAFSASIGSGKLYVFGPEITFRAQTQGTYKFLFNPLYKNQK